MHSFGNELEYGMVSRRDAKTIQIVVHRPFTPTDANLNLSAVLSPCQAWGCGGTLADIAEKTILAIHCCATDQGHAETLIMW